MNFKSLALAAVMVGAGAAANAAVINFDSAAGYVGTGDGVGAYRTETVSPVSGYVHFNWLQTPISVFTTFEVTRAFTLSLTDYYLGNTDRTPTNQQTSGLVVRKWDDASETWKTLTVETANCRNASAATEVRTTCDHIASAVYDGSLDATKPGEAVGTYAAGRYLIGIYDSAKPELANASLKIAAVPLPATGLALIAGLGGLAALGARRRRQNA